MIETTGSNGWHDAAVSSELPDGTMLPVTVAAVQLLLVNVEGTVHAVAPLCTHEQADLADGELEGASIVCPLHYSRFDLLTGEVLDPPADEPLRVYEARVAAGRIQVRVGAG